MPSRALCVLRLYAEYGGGDDPLGEVSVPSRALCVLRLLLSHVGCRTIDNEGFSALSSFVCSATGYEPSERCLRTYQGFSALSSFVCSATSQDPCEPSSNFIRGFQCPLELCVFCDTEEIPVFGTAEPEFQCPLELCVFCDHPRAHERHLRLTFHPFQCPLELCVFCDWELRILTWEQGQYLKTFQCPLELCVFCDEPGSSAGEQKPI